MENNMTRKHRQGSIFKTVVTLEPSEKNKRCDLRGDTEGEDMLHKLKSGPKKHSRRQIYHPNDVAFVSLLLSKSS